MQKTLYVESHKERLFAAVENAGGATENLFFGPVPNGAIWFIERIFHYSNTAQPSPTVTGFVTAQDTGSPRFTEGVEFSSAGGRDIADEVNPIVAFSGEYLRLRWEGIAAADKVMARIQVSVRRPVYVELPDRIDLENPDDLEILGAFLA